MATINNVIAGLQVFAKYGGEEYICAEHDVIYAQPPDGVTLTPEDEKTLTDAGWIFHKTLDSWGVFT
jgi:hypothetical protein